MRAAWFRAYASLAAAAVPPRSFWSRTASRCVVSLMAPPPLRASFAALDVPFTMRLGRKSLDAFLALPMGRPMLSASAMLIITSGSPSPSRSTATIWPAPALESIGTSTAVASTGSPWPGAGAATPPCGCASAAAGLRAVRGGSAGTALMVPPLASFMPAPLEYGLTGALASLRDFTRTASQLLPSDMASGCSAPRCLQATSWPFLNASAAFSNCCRHSLSTASVWYAMASTENSSFDTWSGSWTWTRRLTRSSAFRACWTALSCLSSLDRMAQMLRCVPARVTSSVPRSVSILRALRR
mmetsp:Transcript_56699/g.147372  ORF Transcript_56699/g.147372 Transcript_56699/m.147372 type:complete len:299 (+) Transcript_56699:1633-2529(+)